MGGTAQASYWTSRFDPCLPSCETLVGLYESKGSIYSSVKPKQEGIGVWAACTRRQVADYTEWTRLFNLYFDSELSLIHILVTLQPNYSKLCSHGPEV